MNYVIDFIFAAFAIITVIVFAKRGFFLSLLKFFKLLLAFIAAHLWGDSLGKFLSDKIFYTPIRNSIFGKINKLYEGATEAFNVEAATNAIPKFLRTDAFMQKLNSFEESGEALFTQRNKMVVGDSIEVLTPGKVGVPMVCEQLYDENHEPIEATSHPYMNFYMKTPFELKAGDIIRLA